MADKITELNQSFVDIVYKKYLKKRFGVTLCNIAGDISKFQNQKSIADVEIYGDISSPIQEDSEYRLSCNSCTNAQLPIQVIIPPDPEIYKKIYYGASATKQINADTIESSAFITIPNSKPISIDYRLLHQVNPMYFWVAIPVSISVSTTWFVDINNNGNISGPTDLFSAPQIVTGYNLYITNYKTAFDKIIEFN